MLTTEIMNRAISLDDTKNAENIFNICNEIANVCDKRDYRELKELLYIYRIKSYPISLLTDLVYYNYKHDKESFEWICQHIVLSNILPEIILDFFRNI